MAEDLIRRIQVALEEVDLRMSMGRMLTRSQVSASQGVPNRESQLRPMSIMRRKRRRKMRRNQEVMRMMCSLS